MSYPTGMGAATGNHYNNVAAQMQAYLNNGGGSGGSGGQHLHSAHGHVHRSHPSQGLAYASHAGYSGAQLLGLDPIVSNDVGTFARMFMRNLLNWVTKRVVITI